jgi:hypothetical protein
MSLSNEDLLNEHLATENAHDLDAIMATYVDVPVVDLNGHRIEGQSKVREFHRDFGFGDGDHASFSSVQVLERARHRAQGAIVIEQTLTGVHTGEWQGLAPTGRTFSVAVCTVYVFDDRGRLAIERVYFDQAGVRRQLTTGGRDR